MAVAGVITNEGLYKAIEAMSKAGWKIYPYKFAISEELSDLAETRTYDSMNDTWFMADISGRVVINVHTIEFLCNIPPNSTVEAMYIREVYIIGLDEAGKPFLLAIGQATGDAIYDPSGSVKLRIQISIQNLNMVDLFVFKYTQAQEIFDHNNDPNAHPDLLFKIDDAIEKHNLDPSSHPYILELIKSLTTKTDIMKQESAVNTGILLPGVILPLGEKIHVIDVKVDEVTSTDQLVVHRDAKGSLCREFDDGEDD